MSNIVKIYNGVAKDVEAIIRLRPWITDEITEELKNSGKDSKIVDKIASGKLNKFINDNTLLNQEWIIEPKKKVKEALKEAAGKDKIEIKKFVRFKVGEGI